MERSMDTYQGICKYCGQTQPIMAMDQQDADQKITEYCDCDGAKFEKKKQQLIENLDYTIGEGAVNMGIKKVSEGQESLITEMAMAVLEGKIEKATCQIDSTVITITMASDKCKVKRTDKKAMTLEA